MIKTLSVGSKAGKIVIILIWGALLSLISVAVRAHAEQRVSKVVMNGLWLLWRSHTSL